MQLTREKFLPILGNRMRARREACGLRPKDVAACLGVEVSRYVRFELGMDAIPVWMLPELARLLQADVRYLLCLRDKPR